MKPRTEAIAFRIWSYCEAFGWAQTMAEIAEALDLTTQQVNNILVQKGWNDRVRRVSPGVRRTRGMVISREPPMPPHHLREYGLDPSVRE
jgi:hypothetical protein